ncbi:MAG: FkbM family methyltransferase [Bacteroidia bacterium]|nr:FkbM family methyltransferase [Bacteroidia bacterium]
MKKLIQSILQGILGFERYLVWFSAFKIRTLKWDKKEGDFNYFLSLLKEDFNVLDIGANIGIMTVPLARKCRRGKVYSFEPIPENFKALKRIVSRFKLQNVELVAMALGEEKGELQMVMPEINSVRMQGLSHVVHESIEGYESNGQTYKVPVLPLDQVEKIKDLRVDAIKIDVENFEQYVFAGGKEMLRKFHPIIYCELWDNENREACFSLLRDELGYGIRVLVNGKLEEFSPKVHQKQNFFFV